MALGENLSRARSSDDVSSVRHEVSELRAEMARLRQSTSFQIPPAAHGGIPDEFPTVPPPEYVG